MCNEKLKTPVWSNILIKVHAATVKKETPVETYTAKCLKGSFLNHFLTKAQNCSSDKALMGRNSRLIIEMARRLENSLVDVFSNDHTDYTELKRKIFTANSLATKLLTFEQQPEGAVSTTQKFAERPIGEEAEDLTRYLKSFSSALEFGKGRAFYRIDQSAVKELKDIRDPLLPPIQKTYSGLNQVNQLLRHLATAIHAEAASQNLNMVEVQCSVFCGKVHISSNFHSDRIPEILQALLSKASGTIADHRPEDRLDWKQFDEARSQRHADKLRAFVDCNEREFGAFKERVRSKTDPLMISDEQTISQREVGLQAEEMLNTLKLVLEQVKAGNHNDLLIHSPLAGGVRGTDQSATTHAEQNIQAYIARHANELQAAFRAKTEEDPAKIIIPVAGRYIPCATCHEVELAAKESDNSEFGMNGRFVLHRSTERVGHTYPEKQYLATEAIDSDPAVAEVKAYDIAQNLKHPNNNEFDTKNKGRPEYVTDGNRQGNWDTVYDTDSEDEASTL